MKKKLLLAMFTIATVFSLVACGGDKETASKKEDTKKEESKKDDKDDDKNDARTVDALKKAGTEHASCKTSDEAYAQNRSWNRHGKH